MKKIFPVSFIFAIIISSCSSSSSTTLPENTPTSIATQVPPAITATATEISSTPIFTPTPTLLLPVSQLTPVPSSNTKITVENMKDLQEISRYYGQINYSAKLTKDEKFLFILDPDGITKYDYESMEPITNIALANSASDLQMSNDGNWLLIDNNWLLDIKNDKDSNLYVLSEKINLLNFPTTFSLSPDGSMIAVAQSSCPNTCEYVFRIVSTGDFKDLYTSSGLTLRNLSTFSSDGKYFAVADLLTVETSGGGTEPGGGAVGVWTTNDFTKVSSFSVKFPFSVTDIAFSEDNSLLAIGQRTSIDMIEVLSGNSKANIADLCDSYQRKVMFAPSTTIKVLEHSNCSSNEWTISGSTARLSSGNVPDLSRINFDEKGNPEEIPYPYPTTSDLRAHTEEYYFEFLTNDVLSFKNFDAETLDRHSCDLSLATGSFDCQSHAPESSNGRFLGKDVILATNGKYYSYVVGNSRVDIYSFDNPSQVYYSIPFRDYTFELLALDPINNLVIYNIALSMRANRVIIQDMTNDHVLEKWEGETFISSVAISENTKHAALCRTIGYYTSAISKDRLVIFDLSEKRTVYNTEFNCSGTALGMSADGSRLAVEDSTRTLILNTTPPFEKKYFDFDSWFYPYAVTFSPDGSTVAVACGGSEICFFDSSGANEVFRLHAHSGIANLAFSPDGSLLATSSDWGLISLWAVPPFTSSVRQSQSSPLSFYNPSFYWDFDQDGNFEGWGEQDWQVEGLKNLSVKDGYLSAVVTGPSTRLNNTYEHLGINASDFSKIEISMKVSGGTFGVVYFTHNDGRWSEPKGKYFDLIPDDEFHTYLLDMKDVVYWAATIDQLRVDPVHDAPGTTIEIDYIHLLP